MLFFMKNKIKKAQRKGEIEFVNKLTAEAFFKGLKASILCFPKRKTKREEKIIAKINKTITEKWQYLKQIHKW